MKRLAATLCLTIAVLLGSAGLSQSADFQKGLDAYKSGDYATALREWTPLAEQGHADAQFNLGSMYEYGEGVPQDDKNAVKWYRLAAEQGYARAQIKLGVMYEVGRGVPQDYKTAVKWYRLAAEQGNAHAQYFRGLMYEDGNINATMVGPWGALVGKGSCTELLNEPKPTPRGNPPSDLAEKLRMLKKAVEQGLITTEEAAAKRKSILDKM